MKTPDSQANAAALTALKTALRTQSRARRDALSQAQKSDFSRRIVARIRCLIEEFQPRIIAIYLSNGREADLDTLLPLPHDRIVVAPRAVNGSHPAPFGTHQSTLMHNSEPDVFAPDQIEMFFVPGLAFDEAGRRLGQGGGWYDKVLCRAPQAITVGVAFETQIVAEVPHESHDKNVDYVITEERVILCRRD